MKNIQTISIIPKDGHEIEFTPLQNLYLNMTAGLLPKDLSKDEVDLLKRELGENWFETLGYDDKQHERPKHK